MYFYVTLLLLLASSTSTRSVGTNLVNRGTVRLELLMSISLISCSHQITDSLNLIKDIILGWNEKLESHRALVIKVIVYVHIYSI